MGATDASRVADGVGLVEGFALIVGCAASGVKLGWARWRGRGSSTARRRHERHADCRELSPHATHNRQDDCGATTVTSEVIYAEERGIWHIVARTEDAEAVTVCKLRIVQLRRPQSDSVAMISSHCRGSGSRARKARKARKCRC